MTGKIIQKMGNKPYAGAENGRQDRELRRHMEDAYSNDQRDGKRNERRDMSLELKTDHGDKQNYQRECGPGGR